MVRFEHPPRVILTSPEDVAEREDQHRQAPAWCLSLVSARDVNVMKQFRNRYYGFRFICDHFPSAVGFAKMPWSWNSLDYRCLSSDSCCRYCITKFLPYVFARESAWLRLRLSRSVECGKCPESFSVTYRDCISLVPPATKGRSVERFNELCKVATTLREIEIYLCTRPPLSTAPGVVRASSL